METKNLKKNITIKGKTYNYYSLPAVTWGEVSKLPFSIRILLENAIRNHDGFGVTDEHVHTLANWKPTTESQDIPFKPAFKRTASAK